MTMILNSIQVFTTLFLLFATCFFVYQAYRRSEKTSDMVGNLFCFAEMVLAIFFMWR